MRIFISIFILSFGATLRAGEWPQFRGPNSMSYSDEKGLPTTWGGPDGKNIAWKVALPKADNPFSSPIVCNGRIFLTTVTNKPQHTVLCFDAADGKLLWQTDVPPGPWKLGDLRAGYGAPSPAADKNQVFVFFGSAVLASLDYDGKIIWRKELKNTAFDVGIGTSPILFGDTIILQLDQNGKKSVLVALDKKTGETKWQNPRPQCIFAHSTPIIPMVNGKPQLILSASKWLQGFDPATGTKLWEIESDGETPSPAFGNGLVYVDSGRGGGGVCADITGDKPVLKWKLSKSEMSEGFSSPIFAQGMVYKTHHGDIMVCRKADTGEIVFSEHLKGLSTAITPILTADGLLYFACAGKSFIIKPGPKLDVVASNDLNDPNPGASAAIANGRIYLRGTRFLYCIAGKAEK
ncbi:MAG TPA: PQQ-binding-like beta-propeller repeat protein [Tepidisphaeraceae bacterium]|jgi:outer membrane protein assembly factor BamB|nr:PQQ-binding-like beta-propeller repeat protein [Tepidisphaeraceae bacterium]